MLILTTKGEIEESLLEKEVIQNETLTEISKITIYRLEGEEVKRDVDLILKSTTSSTEIGKF
jgi:hypothetical protein